MNKYTDISQIGYEQLKELHLQHGFVRAFFNLIESINGEDLFWVSHKEYVVGKDFMELTEQDLRNAQIRNLGDSGIQKVIWLQKYLKGEVSGIFVKEEIKKDEYAHLLNRIEELEQCILLLKQENRSLKKEVADLKKEQKKVQSVKNKILQLAKGIDD